MTVDLSFFDDYVDGRKIIMDIMSDMHYMPGSSFGSVEGIIHQLTETKLPKSKNGASKRTPRMVFYTCSRNEGTVLSINKVVFMRK